MKEKKAAHMINELIAAEYEVDQKAIRDYWRLVAPHSDEQMTADLIEAGVNSAARSNWGLFAHRSKPTDPLRLSVLTELTASRLVLSNGSCDKQAVWAHMYFVADGTVGVERLLTEDELGEKWCALEFGPDIDPNEHLQLLERRSSFPRQGEETTAQPNALATAITNALVAAAEPDENGNLVIPQELVAASKLVVKAAGIAPADVFGSSSGSKTKLLERSREVPVAVTTELDGIGSPFAPSDDAVVDDDPAGDG